MASAWLSYGSSVSGLTVPHFDANGEIQSILIRTTRSYVPSRVFGLWQLQKRALARSCPFVQRHQAAQLFKCTRLPLMLARPSSLGIYALPF